MCSTRLVMWSMHSLGLQPVSINSGGCLSCDEFTAVDGIVCNYIRIFVQDNIFVTVLNLAQTEFFYTLQEG